MAKLTMMRFAFLALVLLAAPLGSAGFENQASHLRGDLSSGARIEGGEDTSQNDQSDGHGHGGGHSKGAHAVAVGLIATVVLVPLVVYMALEDGILSELTMKLIDTFISIFLAILWFNCFSTALKTFGVSTMFAYAEEVFGVVQIIILYAIANFIIHKVRDDKKACITFSGCAAHYIAFVAIGTSAISQEHGSEQLASNEVEPVMSFALVCVIIGVLVVGAVANHYIWRKDMKHHVMDECIDELELDILGLVSSFAITQAVRHSITGRYPHYGHFFLQLEGAPGPAHEAWQRWFMFGWAVALTAVAVFVLPILNKMGHDSWLMHHLTHCFKVIVIMLVAWGYLCWGTWQFNETMFKGDPMFGHMVFACLATCVCLFVLWAMSKRMGDNPTPAQRETNIITITGISLVAAWSWEHTFNMAFDIIGNEYQVGYKGLIPKLVLAITIPAALLPTYIRHIKGRVIEDDERNHHAAHHSSAHGDHGS
eukprot:TRINITY_DN721_c0_g1_i3.p1 TRINITY_DN721_c0_g1~~TRINITY_DN721_c0_g1_i3.p1  ORF type:complete len:503 (+),score=95.26 TRINITY_DN721_c0_g1_i3:64-1509(+)